MMRYALTINGPVAIRYAKADYSGSEDDAESDQVYAPRWRSLRPGKDAAILAVGGMNREALLASYFLKESGLRASVYSVGCTQPLDEETLGPLLSEGIPLVTLEENILSGGFGEAVAAWCAQKGIQAHQLLLGIEGLCSTQGARIDQLKAQRLDAQSIAERILAWKESIIA